MSAIQTAIAYDDQVRNSEAAAILSISPSTLNIWRCNNRPKIPYYKRGGRIFYKKSDLEAFKESCKVMPK